VLAAGWEQSIQLLSPKLVSACTLGSLSHGGFAPAVSDVDLDLVLDRIESSVEATMRQIQHSVQIE
jgi:hypothetical protein